MPGDDVIQFIDQLGAFEADMGCSLLKVFDRKHLIFIAGTVPVFMDMIAQAAGNVSAV